MRLSSNLKKFGWHFVHKLTGIHLSTNTIYYDWTVSTAIFLAPIEKIRPKIPKNLHLIETEPSMTSIILRAIRVKKAQGLLPYNEFSIEVPVFFKADSLELPGSFALYMPVTSEESRWGGAEIVGLPKFLADISFGQSPEHIRCKVSADEKELIYFEIQKVPTVFQSWDWYIYGLRDNRLLRTHLLNEGQRGVADVHGGASFRLGTHPISEELRQLEISHFCIQHEYSFKIKSIEERPIEYKNSKK